MAYISLMEFVYVCKCERERAKVPRTGNHLHTPVGGWMVSAVLQLEAD